MTVRWTNASKRNAALLPSPDQPFENFKPVRVKVDAYQTARVDHNRYSVPRTKRREERSLEPVRPEP